jgi:hypothetical protein
LRYDDGPLLPAPRRQCSARRSAPFGVREIVIAEIEHLIGQLIAKDASLDKVVQRPFPRVVPQGSAVSAIGNDTLTQGERGHARIDGDKLPKALALWDQVAAGQRGSLRSETRDAFRPA